METISKRMKLVSPALDSVESVVVIEGISEDIELIDVIGVIVEFTKQNQCLPLRVLEN